MTYRFRFVWDKAHHHDHRARAIDGLVRTIESESTDGHYLTFWIDARKLLAILSISAVVLWFLAAGALEMWLDRSPYNRVRYADLAWPWRWKNIRDLRGQGYIAAGLDEIRAGKIQSGLMGVQQGLARHPDAPAARLTLGKIYARASYYRGLRDTMVPQLKQSLPPREYLEFLLNSAIVSDDHATVVSSCDAALKAPGLTAGDRTWLLTKKAEGLVAQEQYPEALAALAAAGQDSSLEWRRVRISALLGSGHAVDAIKEINGWSKSVPRELQLQMLVRANRQAHRLDDAMAAAKELQGLHPDQLEPWALAVGEFERAGWHDAAWSTAEDAIRRFGADAKAMESLERVCSETRSAELLSLCLENARGMGQPILPDLIDLTVAQLKHGDLARAEQTYEQTIAEDRRVRDPERTRMGGTLSAGPLSGPRPPTLPGPVRDWLRSLIDATALPASDPCGAHTTVLENQRIPPALFSVSAEILAASGHWPALEVLTRVGLAKFPGSTVLTRWSKQAAEGIAAMPKAESTPALVANAKPAKNAPQSAADVAAAVPAVVKYGSMAQDQFFAKIEEAGRRGAWAEVENEIRNVLTAAPPWLPQVQADLTWRQVRAALEQSETLRATLVMGERLRVHPLEATRALALVREWEGRKDRETARKLADTLVTAVPEFRPGQAVLKELKQADKAATPTGTEKR